MPWKCPVCGAENPDDADRCLACGAPRPAEGEAVEAVQLAAEAPAEPQAVEQAEQPAEAQAAAPEPQPAGEEVAVEEAVEAEAGAEEQVEQPAPAEAAEQEAEQPAEAGEAVAEELPPPLPEGARVSLKVINSPAPELRGMTVPLQFDVYGKISIGRSPENVVITPDPSVSRRHAVMYIEEGRLVIEDLGSTNGTFIYNKEKGVFEKVSKAYLKDGDLIRLGEGTVFQVVVETG